MGPWADTGRPAAAVLAGAVLLLSASIASAEAVLPPSVGAALAPLVGQPIQTPDGERVVRNITIDKTGLVVDLRPEGAVTLQAAAAPAPGRWFDVADTTVAATVALAVASTLSQRFTASPFQDPQQAARTAAASEPHGPAPWRSWLGTGLLAFLGLAALVGLVVGRKRSANG